LPRHGHLEPVFNPDAALTGREPEGEVRGSDRLSCWLLGALDGRWTHLTIKSRGPG
jgi:hypothetical protein